MIIKKYLNSLNISLYSIILIFLALITGLFKEIIIIYIIILFHEFGHFIFLNIFNWKIKKIDIYPFGGIIKLDEIIDKPLIEEFIITIMGPIFQIILYLIFYLLYKNKFIDICTYNIFNSYNYSILLFNILPIIPLDGSKLFNIITNKFFNFKISNTITLLVSIITFLLFVYFNNNNSSYYLIITFLLFSTINYIKNMKYLKYKFLLERKLYKNNYKDIKKIKNIDSMYRNKKHIIKYKNSYITENSYLKKEM